MASCFLCEEISRAEDFSYCAFCENIICMYCFEIDCRNCRCPMICLACAKVDYSVGKNIYPCANAACTNLLCEDCIANRNACVDCFKRACKDHLVPTSHSSGKGHCENCQFKKKPSN